MKGKMDGDGGLNPFNPLLRMFSRYVTMDDGIGGRESRKNSHPSAGVPCLTVSLPHSVELRGEDLRQINIS